MRRRSDHHAEASKSNGGATLNRLFQHNRPTAVITTHQRCEARLFRLSRSQNRPDRRNNQMRSKGTLVDWNDGRGFGFIEPSNGGERVFCHIKSFAVRVRRPLAGGFFLALIAGSVNAIALLGFNHQGASHLTGSSTLLGVQLAEGNLAEVMHLLSILLSFVLGAAASGFVIGNESLKLGRRYGVALAAESLLLIAAMTFLE